MVALFLIILLEILWIVARLLPKNFLEKKLSKLTFQKEKKDF